MHAQDKTTSRVSDITTLGTILGIWAHPDDESWTAGGILATAIANGQRVVCITATRGEAGNTADEKRWPQADLAGIREQELEDALTILGIDEHFWLRYKDGHMATSDEQAGIEQIASIINTTKPDTILTFGPDGLTGHPDHKAIGHWAQKAAAITKSNATIYWAAVDRKTHESYGKVCDAAYNIYFNIASPPLVDKSDAAIYLRLSDDMLRQKLDALRAQASQMHMFFDNTATQDSFYHMMAVECFRRP
jgi:LmbE family N-acetylglucosaminyl deacetylase